MSKVNKNQFHEVLRGGGFDNPESFEEDDDYLDSFVECDHCGNDVHMDDARVVKPTQANRKKGHVTNFYCGPACENSHQNSARKGRIGGGLIAEIVADTLND